MNDAVVLPERTVAVAGTVTPGATLSLESETTRPPAGAGLDIDTDPAEGWPPITDVGLSATLITVGAVTARVAVTFVDASVADMVAARLDATATVDTENADVVWLAATVTVSGTVTPFAVLSLASAIVRPPAGAGLPMVTVPVDVVPPN